MQNKKKKRDGGEGRRRRESKGQINLPPLIYCNMHNILSTPTPQISLPLNSSIQSIACANISTLSTLHQESSWFFDVLNASIKSVVREKSPTQSASEILKVKVVPTLLLVHSHSEGCSNGLCLEQLSLKLIHCACMVEKAIHLSKKYTLGLS